MIPERYITQWAQAPPGQPMNRLNRISSCRDSLLKSPTIVTSVRNSYSEAERACNKLRIVPGLRYSEDLDYVRNTAGGIGDLTRALSGIGERLGMKVNVEISKLPKVKFRAPFESGRGSMRIKVEVNTYDAALTG